MVPWGITGGIDLTPDQALQRLRVPMNDEGIQVVWANGSLDSNPGPPPVNELHYDCDVRLVWQVPRWPLFLQFARIIPNLQLA